MYYKWRNLICFLVVKQIVCQYIFDAKKEFFVKPEIMLQQMDSQVHEP